MVGKQVLTAFICPREVHNVYQKIALLPAASLGAVLLTASPSFAQQPSSSAAAQAARELATPTVAGSLGADTKTYSAIVGRVGALILGPAGSNASSLGTGTYEVDFPSDVSACVYTATIGTSPASFLAPAIVTVTPARAMPMAFLCRLFPSPERPKTIRSTSMFSASLG